MARLRALCSILIIATFLSTDALAESHRVGVHFGNSIPRATNDYSAGFVDYSMPIFLPVRAMDSVVATPRLTLSGGTITNNDTSKANDSLMASVGPDLVLSSAAPNARWFTQIGIHPTVMNHYAEKGMGGFYQFTSHLGIGRRITSQGSAMFRLQHSSNASLWSDNRGLDLIVLSLRYDI